MLKNILKERKLFQSCTTYNHNIYHNTRRGSYLVHEKTMLSFALYNNKLISF